VLNLGRLPWPLWWALHVTTGVVSTIAALVFFSLVLRVRRSLLWQIVCLLAAASLVTAALIYFQWTSVGICFAISEACTLPANVWIIATLLVGVFRKDVSARLLLVPVVLSYGMGSVDLVSRIIWQLTDSPRSIDVNLFSWPFFTSLGDVFGYIFLLALLIFLVRRFSLARKEEERLAAEFEAARTIQSLLIPAVPPATPGFVVENVYLPAQEVGGDFFQVLPAEDGTLLVVVGDVSGKGLQAAMTVSAIVGALRDCPERQPAHVLGHLNLVLCGQIGGFVTCLATLIADDGTMTIANAGHLPPYRNGEELAVASGIPLGVLLEADYEERRNELALGDRLTFLSDGVVEAQSASGELFGFDRTRTISTQSAESIAHAAQQFGQEDDITILTIMRVPVSEAVSA